MTDTPMTPRPARDRLCNAAGCDFRTEIDPTDPDSAWDTVTDHYKTAHCMTGPDAAHFASWHSTTEA